MMYTRRQLIILDDIIRQEATKSKRGSRNFYHQVKEVSCNCRIKAPTTKLIRMRAFRVLDDQTLDKIFKHANFLVSLQEINQWRNTSISNILHNNFSNTTFSNDHPY